MNKADKARVEEVREAIENKLEIFICAFVARTENKITSGEMVCFLDDFVGNTMFLKDSDGKPMIAILSDDQGLPTLIDRFRGQVKRVLAQAGFRRVIIEGE